MKLRNKKTGEIIEFACIHICNYHTNNKQCEEKDVECRSLEKLLENWEDYKPAEPLIKDEKIRKAVRAWAEITGQNKLLVIKMAGRLEISDGSPHLIYISFRTDKETMNNLQDRTYYTLEELCGSEE